MATPPAPPISPALQSLATQLASAPVSTVASMLPRIEPVVDGRIGCTAALVIAALDIAGMSVAMSTNQAAWALTEFPREGIGGAITGLTIGGAVVALIGAAIAGTVASKRASARPRSGHALGVVIDRGWTSKPIGTNVALQMAVVVRYEAEGATYDAQVALTGVLMMVEEGKPTPAIPEEMPYALGRVVDVFYEPDNFGNVGLERPSGGAWIKYLIGMLMFGVIGCGMIGTAIALLIDVIRS
ncbi:hypothetical protein ACNOYE_34230 [Nannocystaceae bacterium ST9]